MLSFIPKPMQANLLSSVILPIALAIIMLGMGLSLVPEDFQRVKQYPKAVSIGLISHTKLKRKKCK